MADILHFKPHKVLACAEGDFRKALAAITILMDFNAEEALQLIDIWIARGFVSEDEAAALHAFYGWWAL